MTAAIEARALTKRFGSLAAVDAVDLRVEPGEFFGLLGPNGAGKTTIVRMLIGIVPITSGEARIGGIDVRSDPDGVRRVLGVVPQALTSDVDLTGYENMDIHARYFGVERTARRRRIEELLRRVGLWDRRKDLVRTYSGGMRRRLEIARGLIHKPAVLFLDEPTIGLDPQSRHVIWDLLRDLRQGTTLTISLTTHYLDEAEALCDRVAIVDEGRVIAIGSPRELESQIPGSDTLEIGIGTAPSEECLARLSALPNVRELSREERLLRIRADGGAEVLPRALAELERSGVPVLTASMTRITLEDVFIRLTGKSLRDDKPNHAPPGSRRVA